MALSLRLQTVLQLVQSCEILADIGTDHAYLPIEAVRLGICKKAIASDIQKGPLESAFANIQAAGLSSYIETRLGDGLTPLKKNEADCIVISGLGGMRIWNILQQEQEKARYAKKLVLQPQHNLEDLRKKLHNTGYEIASEKLVYENSRFYVILAANYTGEFITWTQREYFLGKYLHESPHFLHYITSLKKQISGYVQFIMDDDARQITKTKLLWIESLIQEE